MHEFVYLFRGGERPASPEGMQQLAKKWVDWVKQLREKGHLKDPGAPLEMAGKIVKGRQKDVVDGSFVVSDDVIGGFISVKARDLGQAVELSMECPILGNGGEVEVRPVMGPDRS
jgi:hypothetical protein